MPERQEGDDPNLLDEAGLRNKGGCSLSDLALCMTLISVRHITLGALLMQGAAAPEKKRALKLRSYGKSAVTV